MSERKASTNGAGGPSRQVFRLSPSLHFSRQARRASLFFTLRARLIASFLIVALAPAALFAYFDTRSTQVALTNAANQSLYSAARQTRDTLDAFIKSHVYAVSEDSNSQVLVRYLELPAENQPVAYQRELALEELNSLYDKDYSLNNFVLAYVLMNKTGKVLLDSSSDSPDQSTPFLGLDKADSQLFNLMISSDRPYVSSVIFPASGGMPVFYFVTDVKDNSRHTIGLLAARYNAALVQSFIEQNLELAGARSYAAVYDGNFMRLAQGANPQVIFRTVVPLDPAKTAALQKAGRLPKGDNLSTNLPTLAAGLTDVDNAPYFSTLAAGTGEEINAAAAIRLDNKDWTVVYLQPEIVFLAPLRAQTRTTLLMAVALAAAATLFGLFVTRRLTTPIEKLTRTAEKVAAGDLWAQAPESQDEIGVLASAFNTMTTELRRTLEGLEQRIAERTSQLARASEQMKHRANQLQTVTEVAHVVASIQDPEQLLLLVTQLISERFSYYHTGIFMVDAAGEYAILRAANSQGGQRMLSRGHKLKIGQEGIVGFAVGQGEPRIALDVGEDAVFFDNPDLPNTRSEMALPLKIGEKVIGALDVQTDMPSAFSQEDIAVLGALADQVAIAIENARLFAETRSTLTELQTLHGQYLQQQWTIAVGEYGKSGYQYRNGRLEPITSQAAFDWWKMLDSGQPALVDTPGDGHDSQAPSKSLVAPITVRGQVIGSYDLGEPETPGGWDEEDIELVRAVADQVGLALENARLLEQTRERAEREHLVAEITSKLRASNDPQTILETAKRELRQALRARKAEILQPNKYAPGDPGGGQPEGSNGETLGGGNGSGDGRGET